MLKGELWTVGEAETLLLLKKIPYEQSLEEEKDD